jgi:hypothetical protein
MAPSWRLRFRSKDELWTIAPHCHERQPGRPAALHRQHDVLTCNDDRFGMSDEEYAEAQARSAAPAEREPGQ